MSDHRIELSVQATVNESVRWIVTCVCGWHSTARDQQEADRAGLVHRRIAQVSTVICDGCADVIPARMIEEVGPDMLCPECYNIVEPVTDPTETISDLRALEQELRPVAWDGM